MQNEELRNTQIRLEDSRRKYFNLYNFAPIGYFTLDKNGIILDVNLAGASMLGVERLNLNNCTFIKYIDPTCRNRFHKHLKEVLETGTQKTIDIKLLKMDDDYFYAHLETDVEEENGNFKEFRIALTDISDQKEAEIILRNHNANINKMLKVGIDDYKMGEQKLKNLIEQYKISNKELEQFAYVSSHDLKEPLRMVTSFLQLLQKRYSDDLDEDANDFIDFAVEGAKRMDSMINDLLEYSRIGSTEREYEYIQSQQILETVLRNLKSSIEDNHARITNDPLPLIYANENMMVQLFQNLISNAIKYHGKENPVIHVSAKSVDDTYVFAVQDNGIGIDQKHLDRIFTIFQRLHSRDEYDGTGIGLAISKRIIQKHHGDIWIESEPGKGTIFYFSIPNRNY